MTERVMMLAILVMGALVALIWGDVSWDNIASVAGGGGIGGVLTKWLSD